MLDRTGDPGPFLDLFDRARPLVVRSAIRAAGTSSRGRRRRRWSSRNWPTRSGGPAGPDRRARSEAGGDRADVPRGGRRRAGSGSRSPGRRWTLPSGVPAATSWDGISAGLGRGLASWLAADGRCSVASRQTRPEDESGDETMKVGRGDRRGVGIRGPGADPDPAEPPRARITAATSRQDEAPGSTPSTRA